MPIWGILPYVKLLVLTSEPISAAQLRDALSPDLKPEEAEVMVVAPALQESGIHFWMSDADEAIAKAEEVRRETVERLGQEGVPASGETGESDPLQAIQDALQSFPADRIVVFSHRGEDQDYREDFEPGEIEERFGLPVDQARVSA
jgi:nucleotide-binding universal stress UspA family protein